MTLNYTLYNNYIKSSHLNFGVIMNVNRHYLMTFIYFIFTLKPEYLPYSRLGMKKLPKDSWDDDWEEEEEEEDIMLEVNL